ncbi:hypothetical protein D3C86_2035880 [compost metagenome]
MQQRLQIKFRVDVKPPCPLRPQEPLVARESEHVDIHISDMDRQDTSALGRIYEQLRAVITADLTDFFNRHDRAKQVRAVIHNN